jgi:hypothetical protein
MFTFQRPHHVPRTAVLFAAVAFLFSVVFTAASSAAIVGVNSDITWGIPASDVSREVSLTSGAGIKWIRASVDLSQVEPQVAGQINTAYLTQIDSQITAARNAGLSVLLEFDRTPYWASADPGKYTDATGQHWNRYWAYVNPGDYASITSALVTHFKALGINAYELWNEPNNSAFWPSGPSAAAYTALLKASYPAIKAADPSATVVMGGLSNKSSYTYLQDLYVAGAKGSYDVANFHIYPEGDPTSCLKVGGRPYEGSLCLLQGLRAVMQANGDTAPVWVSELGWSTCTQDSYCYSQSQQASWITSAYRMLDSSSYSWVQAAFVYQMRDLSWDTTNAAWDSSLGLLNRDFSPKPAYAALQAVATASTPAPVTGGTGHGHHATRAPLTRDASARAARTTSIRVSLRARKGSGKLLAQGRVTGTVARIRHITLTVQPRRGRRWGASRRIRLKLTRSGGFRGRVALQSGRWRVRASCGAVASALQTVRVA